MAMRMHMAGARTIHRRVHVHAYMCWSIAISMLTSNLKPISIYNDREAYVYWSGSLVLLALANALEISELRRHSYSIVISQYGT